MFQLTLLMRGATLRTARSQSALRFQLTLLMRGATISSQDSLRNIPCFNSRSSCEERRLLSTCSQPDFCFNSRSSCEERLLLPPSFLNLWLFQLTLLMRGATVTSTRLTDSIRFQLTLLMRGATFCFHKTPFIACFNSRFVLMETMTKREYF